MGAGEPSQRGSVPSDLLVVVGLALALVVASLVPISDGSPIRLALAALAVLLSGYALVAALFPRRRLGAEETPGTLAERARQLDGFDRLVLSLGSGLVVTPLLGIGLDFSPWPLREGPMLVTILGFVLGASLVAAVRRRRLPPEERYAPGRRWKAAVTDTDLTSQYSIVTVVVAVAVLVAAGGVLAVASDGQTGERFTEFYVLGSEGEQLLAGSYPDTVTTGENVRVVLGIENREGRAETYTVLTRLQEVRREENDTQILRQQSFETVRMSVGPGEVGLRDHSISPTMAGENLRLTLLLYKGDPPADPSTANAYRTTHLWLNVTTA